MSGLYFGLILAVPIAVIAYLVLAPSLRSVRRKKLRDSAPPAGLEAVLWRNVPLYSAMPEELQEQLLGHVNVFLAEKQFIGCGGQEISDEIRFTIAGTACMLLLNREADYFPGFTSILVYPDTFESNEIYYDGDVEVHERVARAGESWDRGPVVLSWRDVIKGVAKSGDGLNVVLHEFAHKLDEQYGGTDGMPELERAEHFDEWVVVLTREYKALAERVDAGDNSVLDDYGLTSPPEFFAVATESFFEKPAAMRERLPDLYEQLRRFYRVDPASWRQQG